MGLIRGVLRMMTTVLLFLLIGVIVVAATGGPFTVGGSVTGCPVETGDGTGPIPDLVHGGYEASLSVQAGDIVVEPAVTVLVKPDTVTVAAAPCQHQQ